MCYDSELIDKIKGFMDPVEGRALYDTALVASKKGPCLEIGSYCGKSTVYLGAACRENNGVLFTIDHHRGSEEQQKGEAYFDPELFDSAENRVDTFRYFQRSMENAGLEDSVVPVVSRSHVVARTWATPLSLVFIDGGHSFETAFTDYNCWAGHVMPGGFLLIHDIFEKPEDGGQAPWEVYSLALKSGLFRELSMVGTLAILQRLHGGEMLPG